MTKAAVDFNLKYNLNVTPSSFEEVKQKNIANELSGRPKKNITQVLKRFFTNPWAVAAFLVFIAIVIASIVIPYTTGYSANASIAKTAGGLAAPDLTKNQLGSDTLREIVIPDSGMKQITDNLKLATDVNHIGSGEYFIIKNYHVAGLNLVKYNPWDLITISDGGSHHNSILGTDANSYDIWTRTWSGTWESLKLAFAAAIIATIVGVLIGGWIGMYAGSVVDIIFMKVISVYQAVPQIFWYVMIAALLPAGFGALLVIFIATGWMSSMSLTRIQMWRYVNSDFMKAAKTLGVSQWGRILKHALPNFLGYILLSMVASIPVIIEGEASLGFLGLSPNPLNASLGNVLNEMKSTVQSGTIVNIGYLLLPTLIILTITMSLYFIAIGLSDAVDPKFRKR